MSTTMKAWVVAFSCVAGVAIFAANAAADDSQNEMSEMHELVLQLQDQMQAQQLQIDAQKSVIEDAGLADERTASSRISSFLETTDFSGWVAASYFYNTNNPEKDNSPASPFSNSFHSDPNGFQFDEAWFVMDRPATEESPAGYHFEAVFGATASAFGNSSAPHGGGNDIWISSANVSYLTPWGQEVTAGKFGTTIGYEVAGAPSNVNITRGFTYNLFQPISHVGATVSQSYDNGVTYTLGIVNGFSEEQPDRNESKGFLWQLGWGNDTSTLLFNGYYTPEVEGTGSSDLVLDAVAEFVPSDNVLVWANFDYRETKVGPNDPWGIGLALGTRVAVNDKLGVGGRFEYAYLDSDSGLDGNLFSGTVTTDYALTDNLTWKLEAKYEAGTDDLESSFSKGGSNGADDAVFLGTQLYYEF